MGTVTTYFLSIKLFNNKPKENIIKDSNFQSLYDTYDIIKEKYYKDIDDDTLINGAINGLMESLDDKHSMFFDKEAKKDFENELSGSYYGIGAEIKQVNDDEVMINKVFDGSPAEKAGLKSGDIFISIDVKETKVLTAI